jgi:hypothetical protein
MNWKHLYLTTPITQTPKILNDNFTTIEEYINNFYDGSLSYLKVPLQTSGRVKAGRGEFVTSVVDNLIVKSQFTNLYENTTTIDSDFYTEWKGVDSSTRTADASIMENTKFRYIDVNQPYYKIANDVSIAFSCDELGQEFQIIFDACTTVGNRPFNILLDPSVNGTFKIMRVTAADSSMAWVKLIAVEYDASWGTTWLVKQYGGNISIGF